MQEQELADIPRDAKSEINAQMTGDASSNACYVLHDEHEI